MGRRTRLNDDYSAQGDRGDCSFHPHTLPDKVIDKQSSVHYQLFLAEIPYSVNFSCVVLNIKLHPWCPSKLGL